MSLQVPAELRDVLAKPVGIFGDGVSGQAVAGLLSDLGVESIIYSAGLKEYTNEHSHELIVYSPGFGEGHEWLNRARSEGILCIGELDFGFLFWPGRLIAVTGTNGKTSLVRLLVESLQAVGIKALACGNIGLPLSGVGDEWRGSDTVAVCEVSSFQAESIRYFRSDALFFTHFDEDHLDRHQHLAGYFKAKWRLVERLKEGGRVYLGRGVREWSERFEVDVPDFITEAVDCEGVGVFSRRPQLDNYSLVAAYWREMNYDKSVLEGVAAGFKLSKHRMECVWDTGRVRYWNDSKATNFSAALSGVKGLMGRVLWIGGGKSKGGDIRGFGGAISGFVDRAYLIGESASDLYEALEGTAQVFNSLDAALIAAHRDAEGIEGEVDVVLSPGFSSFDMFGGYEDRGNSFEKSVFRLKMSPDSLEHL